MCSLQQAKAVLFPATCSAFFAPRLPCTKDHPSDTFLPGGDTLARRGLTCVVPARELKVECDSQQHSAQRGQVAARGHPAQTLCGQPLQGHAARPLQHRLAAAGLQRVQRHALPQEPSSLVHIGGIHAQAQGRGRHARAGASGAPAAAARAAHRAGHAQLERKGQQQRLASKDCQHSGPAGSATGESGVSARWGEVGSLVRRGAIGLVGWQH